jgi:hypothetical protein
MGQAAAQVSVAGYRVLRGSVEDGVCLLTAGGS